MRPPPYWQCKRYRFQTRGSWCLRCRARCESIARSWLMERSLIRQSHCVGPRPARDRLSTFMISPECPQWYNNGGRAILIRRWLHTPFFLVTLISVPGVLWQRGRGGGVQMRRTQPCIRQNRNNEFPSPFSHCMHRDIQLAIKHGLVIQWLMSLAALVKGLGLTMRLGDWLRLLPVYIPIMVAPLSPLFASLSLSLSHTHTHTHTHAH